MGRGATPAGIRAVELVRQGMSRAEAARQTGMSAPGVSTACRRAGLAAALRDGLQDVDRAQRAAAMFRQGLTLETIGQHFGITRERIRQILKKQGLVGKDGGQRKRSTAKKDALRAKQDSAALARWGIPYDQMKEHRSTGLLHAFKNQRRCAAARGIDWKLSFAQWLEVWLASGKLSHRGRGKDKYAMSRIKDSGGYEVGNVHIQTNSENGREAIKQWVGKRKEHRGVYRLYPGTSRPYVARFGRFQIARCATAAEAAAARQAHLERLQAAGNDSAFLPIEARA